MRLRVKNVEAVTLERKPADNCRIHRRRMRKRRAPESRRELAHSRAAADAIGPLEYEGLQASLREKRRGNETVVTGTDDDDVVAHGV